MGKQKTTTTTIITTIIITTIIITTITTTTPNTLYTFKVHNIIPYNTLLLHREDTKWPLLFFLVKVRCLYKLMTHAMMCYDLWSILHGDVCACVCVALLTLSSSVSSFLYLAINFSSSAMLAATFFTRAKEWININQCFIHDKRGALGKTWDLTTGERGQVNSTHCTHVQLSRVTWLLPWPLGGLHLIFHSMNIFLFAGEKKKLRKKNGKQGVCFSSKPNFWEVKSALLIFQEGDLIPMNWRQMSEWNS